MDSKSNNVFYIIPPGPDSDRFTLLEQDKNLKVNIPHMRDEAYSSKIRATFSMYKWERKNALIVKEKKYWKAKYKKIAKQYPEYIL